MKHKPHLTYYAKLFKKNLTQACGKNAYKQAKKIVYSQIRMRIYNRHDEFGELCLICIVC